MPDITDVEHPDNPTNSKSEMPAGENKPSMEVHHDAHHEGKKNWNSYFWEFLMLFQISPGNMETIYTMWPGWDQGLFRLQITAALLIS